MLKQYDEILTVKDVSEILLIGRNRVYELLETEQLKAFRIGKTWKIPKQSLEEYISTLGYSRK